MTRNVGSNSAGRLFHVLYRYQQKASGAKSWVIWLDALGIPSSGNTQRDPITVTRYLDALMGELDATATAYEGLGFPMDLFSTYQTRIQHALQVELLHHPKDNTIQYLDSLVMLSLRWWSVVLPDDDFGLDGESMTQLDAQINALEEALGKDGIPPNLRSYASHLLNDLRAAMFMSRVQGSKPLREAMRKAVSEAHFEEESLKAELVISGENPEVKSVVSSIGAAVKTMANMVGDAERFAKGYGYLLTKATEVGEAISNAIP